MTLKSQTAFEAEMVRIGAASSMEFIAHCREGDGYREGLYKDAYVGWRLALAYAAETAKPVASIRKRKDHHQWAVYVPTSLTAAAFDFPHKEDAIKWAVDRGYRVE